MKNPYIRIVFLAAALGILMLSFACGPTANDNGRSQNLGPAQSNVNVTIVDRDVACNAANIDDRLAQTQTNLNGFIAKDDELKNHVTAKVVKAGDENSPYLEIHLTGEALGEDELEDLSKIVRKFMHKDKNCVKKAIFIVPSDENTDESKRSRGFEWTSCEFPAQLCSNGACMNPCPGKSNTNITNTNSGGTNSTNQNN